MHTLSFDRKLHNHQHVCVQILSLYGPWIWVRIFHRIHHVLTQVKRSCRTGLFPLPAKMSFTMLFIQYRLYYISNQHYSTLCICQNVTLIIIVAINQYINTFKSTHFPFNFQRLTSVFSRPHPSH